MLRRNIAMALCIAASVATAGGVRAADDAMSHPHPAPSWFDSLSVSGSAALTSDYVFRGITQNDESITPQYNLELAHDSGFYAGLWGSPVDFNDGDEAELEFDVTLGYRYEYEAWSADIRYVYYAYPTASRAMNYNYSELMFDGSYDFGLLSVGGLFAWSPEFFGESGDAEYVQAYVDVPLAYGFSAHGHVGKQFISDNATFGFPDTVDWGVGIGYEYEQIGLDVSYLDTDLNRTECADGCSGRLVGTISYNF